MSVAHGSARVVFDDEQRVDGREKVAGAAKFSADFAMDGMLWAAFVTSPLPHARIVSIDAAAARAMPGVHAVLTGAEIGERYIGRILFDWPVLAFEKVRFIGDHVAAVAAETREIARTAAAAIDVTYDELPLIDDASAAITSDVVLHQGAERYSYSQGQRPALPHPNMQGYTLHTHGDAASGFARAERIFEHTFTTARTHAGYIEPRACLVSIDAGGVVHVITTNKAPFALRQQLATCTGLSLERIVVEPAYIGGDFGSKGLSIEEFQCYYLARATGRPVKHVRPYTDEMRSGIVRAASQTTLRSGIDADGHFTALDVRIVFDGGAYAAGKPTPNLIPGLRMQSPYHFPSYRLESICAYTTTIPSGQVRDPGGVQGVFALESHVDAIARELGVDPLEFRRRNAIGPGEVSLGGSAFAEPRALEVLETLAAAVGWSRPLAAGRGRGVSLTSRHVGGGKTAVKLVLARDGSLRLRIGAAEQGGGVLTMAGRIVATVLDIDPSNIDVARGDTASAPFDPGTGGSRATHIVSRAALDAAEQLHALLKTAGYPNAGWEAAVAAVVRDGPIEIIGTYDDNHRPGDLEWSNFCAYAAEISIDHETGCITTHDVTFVADVGTIVNPVAHGGQLDGGFAFGFGHALTEEVRLEDGAVINPSLADYKIPTQPDMPPFRVVLLPTGRGPGAFGAKMAGELATSGVPAAFANAIADACGKRLTTLPLTAERIFNALQAEVIDE